MNGDYLLSNLAAYSAQVAALVALGTALFYLLRLEVPRLRHAYWRALLALCLMLPLLQPWRTREVPAAPAPAGVVTAQAVTLNVDVVTGRVTSNAPVDWPAIAVRVLLAGTAFRLLWVGVGLWGLRRLRDAGVTAEPSEYADLKAAVGAPAEIRYVRGVDQPVAFGAWRPVIVLPDALRDHPADVQRAVVCHELWHVKRRDWTWLLVEEGVRAALWFHPAVWWAISRIHLTREEAVDAAVVATTGQRRVYAEALMAFADAAPLTPAAAFSRRRHLVTRILLISKEAVMSSKRIVVSCVAMAAALAAGSWYAVQAFPLQGGAVATAPTPGQRVAGPLTAIVVQPAGPVEQKARPITPENPIPRRTYSVPVQRPSGAEPWSGLLMVRITLDASGNVAEARNLADLPLAAAPYLSAAIGALRQWRYDPPAEAPISFGVRVTVLPTGDIVALQSGQGEQPFVAVGAARAGGARGGRVGTPGGVVGGVVGGVPGALVPPPPAPGAPIRVGSGVMPPAKTRHVNPEYPAIAQSARVQGVVIVELFITPEGTVQDARILRSIPLLDQAALDAVRQWEFTPTLLNGQPTPIIMTATVQFTLSTPEPEPAQ